MEKHLYSKISMNHLKMPFKYIHYLIIASTILALSSPQPAVAATKAPIYREIKDWLVACDNTHLCEAKGFSDDYEGLMRVTQEAGAAGKLTVEISAPKPFSIKSLQLDGKMLSLNPQSWKAMNPRENGVALVSKTSAAAYQFLRSIRDGRLLTIKQPTDSEEIATVSLNGLAATLLLVDDVQGRLGNETALIRRGTQPADSTPAAPVAPTLPTAPHVPPLSSSEERALIKAVRQKQRAILQSQCDGQLEERHEEAAPLGTERALVIVECNRAAYQSHYLLFQISRRTPGTVSKLMLPPDPRDSKPIDASYDGLMGAEYNPKTATLSQFNKGRGLTDCGSATEWRFDGKAFRLASYMYQGKCGGETGDWPALWQSK